ncbi:leucine-rich melanocyte differentiation-associated protein-like [Bradysia coprophila]|uniref:leucine-rich melanocyte differentiation-associated protein-like n=1 Tax=Bradysia coprophila TaxID=38358 RepID=UPI00187D9944|nr:leucine-rich melanocyte differentiation-associated protein-like [Bradysia coprophila]
MNRVAWSNVLFDEADEKLIFVDQELTTLPDAVVNLYHSRVRKMDLSFNQLTSLDGVEFFSRLDELILDNNQLGDNIRIPKTKSITTLSLNNNKITNLNILLIKLSTFLPNIAYLSLLGNPACPNEFFATKSDYQNYRYFVVSALPNLKFLDSSKVSSFERQNADELSTIEENPFLKFFDPKNIFKNFTKSRNVLYSPLPDSFRAAGEHRGVYKKCRCEYVGDQSEGNRFISNKDL